MQCNNSTLHLHSFEAVYCEIVSQEPEQVVKLHKAEFMYIDIKVFYV